MRYRLIIVAIGIIGLGQSVPAAAQKKLGVGLFAPELLSENPAERFNYIRGVANHLSSALGMPVEGYAYKGVADFDRDRRSNKIHFAIVGPVFLSSARGLQVLATSRFRTAADGKWTIMSKKKVALSAMKGTRLQIPNMGPITIGLVQNGLLGGAIEVETFFQVKRTPDINSAFTAVRIGLADAVVGPMTTPGLVPLIEGISMPSPSFVQLDKRLPGAVVSKAASAMLAYGATFSSISGWQAANAVAYRSLAGSSRKRVYKMSLSSTRIARLQLMDFVGVDKIRFQMPEMEDLYWIP